MYILQFIKENLNGDLQNCTLAAMVNMSTNSFARLFKENTGESVQQFIIRSRIEQARLLLHHSKKSIDTIASECGFCDRHHFSKIFKQCLDMSPGYYKQHITIQ
jgi:transcriptional regulator GlxA family with amidase domain